MPKRIQRKRMKGWRIVSARELTHARENLSDPDPGMMGGRPGGLATLHFGGVR
jgi:hypothetical protein